MSASIWPATSLTRSDPLGQFGEVITTGIARARQASATSSASVATTTGSIRPLALAARHTHSTIGRPALGRSPLRATRVDSSRAGMTAAMRRELMQSSVHGHLKIAARERAETFDLSNARPYHWNVAITRVFALFLPSSWRGSSDG